MIPQLIYLGLTMIGLGMIISKHGQPKEGNHNAWSSIIASIVIGYVLYLGGFFNPMMQ